MTTLRRCLQLLDENNFHYTHTSHPNAYTARDVAAAECWPASQIAKTMIFCGDNCYAMAALPADCKINLQTLAKTLGLARIRLATEVEVAKLFPDSEVGAMPPVGTLFNLPVYLDERLSRQKHIVFNAGTHRDTIHMSVPDFLKLATPLIANFAASEE